MSANLAGQEQNHVLDVFGPSHDEALEHARETPHIPKRNCTHAHEDHTAVLDLGLRKSPQDGRDRPEVVCDERSVIDPGRGEDLFV